MEGSFFWLISDEGAHNSQANLFSIYFSLEYILPRSTFFEDILIYLQ